MLLLSVTKVTNRILIIMITRWVVKKVNKQLIQSISCHFTYFKVANEKEFVHPKALTKDKRFFQRKLKIEILLRIKFQRFYSKK